MKIKVLIILVLTTVNIFSQRLDSRIVDYRITKQLADTCNCSRLTIKQYNYNCFGKMRKKSFSERVQNYENGYLKKSDNYYSKFDSIGRLIKVYYPPLSGSNGNLLEVEYTNNKFVVKEYRCTDKNNCNLYSISRYYYNSDSTIGSSVHKGISYASKSIYFYEYDYYKNLIKKYSGNSHAKDSSEGKSIVMEYKYDNNNNEIKYVEYRPYPFVIRRLTRKFNKKNQIIEKRIYENTKIVMNVKYEYYGNGLKKSETYYDKKGKFDSKYIFEYNLKGYKTKVTKVNKRGKPKMVEVYEYQ